MTQQTAEITPFAPSIPRYTYRSPSQPVEGNHVEAQRWFLQAASAQREQRYSDAVQAYRRSTEADPAFFDAYYNLGLAASEAGDTELALTSYETALALRPDSLDARYNFALVLKQSKFMLDAANELEKLLSTYPNDSRAHLALGNLYAQDLQQPARARPHYLKVLETDPRNPQAPAIQYWLTRNPVGNRS
jgi:tetratricopeptide (TPR) repeat protein